MSYDVMEMHPLDEDADVEKALCGADTSDDLRGAPERPVPPAVA